MNRQSLHEMGPGPGAVVIGLLVAVAGLSGCASGFVSGGVATASADDGRISVESRTANAAIGPSGPATGAKRSSATICVDPNTGATFPC